MGGLLDRLTEYGDETGWHRTDIPDSDLLDLCRKIHENPKTVELPDGRDVGYADLGDPDGTPLLLFHGHPNSRVFGALFDEVAREAGVRLFALDRTGIGRSDPKPDRTLLDWPVDVANFMDAHDIDAAPIVGVSAGGPFALACGATIPDRVTALGTICAVGPRDAVGFRKGIPFIAGQYASVLWKLNTRKRLKRARNDPVGYLESNAADAPDADKPLWRGEFGHALMFGTLEGCRRGLSGYTRDAKLLGSPWPFDLGDVSVPLTLRHGTADGLVPVEMGRYIAERVPDVDAAFPEGLGHLAIIDETKGDVVRAVTKGG